MLATNYRNTFLSGPEALDLYASSSDALTTQSQNVYVQTSFYERACDFICHILDGAKLTFRLISRGKKKTLTKIIRGYSENEKRFYTNMHFLSPDDIKKHLCLSEHHEDVPLGRFNLLHFKHLQRKLHS